MLAVNAETAGKNRKDRPVSPPPVQVVEQQVAGQPKIRGGNRKLINLEDEIYVIQYRNKITGCWETLRSHSRVVGKTAAFKLRNRCIKQDPSTTYRSIQKSLADSYAAGWNDRVTYEQLEKKGT